VSIKYEFPFAAWTPDEDNTPDVEYVDNTNVDEYYWALDDTVTEQLRSHFVVPDNATGTVTFTVHCRPATGAASKNVQLRLGHRAIADGETIEGTYTNEDSGDLSISDTTGERDVLTWTETLANLGWVAGDMVEQLFERIAASADDLSGDLLFKQLDIDIPVT